MNSFILYPIFLIVGIIAGIGSGMLGIGGGIVFIPSLLFLLPFLGCSPESVISIAIATSLFAASFSTFSACCNHLSKKNIDLKLALIFAGGAIAAAIILPHFVIKLNPFIRKYVLLVILTLICLKILFEPKSAKIREKKLSPFWLTPIGVFLGGLATLSGIGGGAIAMPVLHYLYNLPVKRAVGTSSLVVASTVIVATLSFAFTSSPNFNGDEAGVINYTAGILLGIGAIIGSYIGVKLVLVVNPILTKKIFATILIISILKLLA